MTTDRKDDYKTPFGVISLKVFSHWREIAGGIDSEFRQA